MSTEEVIKVCNSKMRKAFEVFSHDLALLAHNTDITDKTTLLGIEKVTAECKRGRGVIDVFIAMDTNSINWFFVK